jgi:hypothetical protein
LYADPGISRGLFIDKSHHLDINDVYPVRSAENNYQATKPRAVITENT